LDKLVEGHEGRVKGDVRTRETARSCQPCLVKMTAACRGTRAGLVIPVLASAPRAPPQGSSKHLRRWAWRTYQGLGLSSVPAPAPQPQLVSNGRFDHFDLSLLVRVRHVVPPLAAHD